MIGLTRIHSQIPTSKGTGMRYSAGGGISTTPTHKTSPGIPITNITDFAKASRLMAGSKVARNLQICYFIMGAYYCTKALSMFAADIISSIGNIGANIASSIESSLLSAIAWTIIFPTTFYTIKYLRPFDLYTPSIEAVKHKVNTYTGLSIVSFFLAIGFSENADLVSFPLLLITGYATTVLNCKTLYGFIDNVAESYLSEMQSFARAFLTKPIPPEYYFIDQSAAKKLEGMVKELRD